MASVVSRRFFSTTARRMAQETLKNESKRNPETIVRYNCQPLPKKA